MNASHSTASTTQNYQTRRKKAAESPSDPDLSSYVFGKIQPQAVPLEEAVLGALMLDREALPIVQDILTADSFYLESHQLIFRAAIRLFERSEPIDLLTLTQEMRSAGDLGKVNGGYYLVELTNKVASAANIEYHARIIQQKYLARQMLAMGTTVTRDAYEDTIDVFDLIDQTEKTLFDIGRGVNARQMVPVGSTFAAVLQEVERAVKLSQKSGVIGVPCGIRDIDGLTGGFRNSDLIIIAARPGMGKTAFTLKTAVHAAQNGCPVAFFSLEMSVQQLSARIISLESEVNGEKMRLGQNIQDVDWIRMSEASKKLDRLPLYIDDTPGISVRELRSKARRAVQQHGVRLIIVDYLQLMVESNEKGGKSGNREQEIAAISRALKGLAKELDVPVIALAQLSRAVETRGGDKRPQLSDLRESGAIENDADMIGFLYRPEYYQIFESETGENLRGIAEFIVRKHRHGRLDTIKMQFIDHLAKFDNLVPDFFGSSVANKKPNALSLRVNPAADPTSEASFPTTDPAAAILGRNRNEEDIPF